MSLLLKKALFFHFSLTWRWSDLLHLLCLRQTTQQNFPDIHSQYHKNSFLTLCNKEFNRRQLRANFRHTRKGNINGKNAIKQPKTHRNRCGLVRVWLLIPEPVGCCFNSIAIFFFYLLHLIAYRSFSATLICSDSASTPGAAGATNYFGGSDVESVFLYWFISSLSFFFTVVDCFYCVNKSM